MISKQQNQLAMKQFFLSLIAMISIAIPAIAEESRSDTSARRIGLEVHQTHKSSIPHRIPMLINVEAYYNEEDGVIEIWCDRDTNGEVYLYLNDEMIGYSPNINSSFSIVDYGIYKIEIINDNWIAEGYIVR